jgi:hypothetical protein
MKATNMERFGYEYISQDPSKKQAVLKGMLKHIAEKKYTLDELREIFKKASCELLESSNKDIKTPMRFKCLCGKEGKITYNKFSAGHRCSDNDCMELRKKHTNLDKFGTEYATQSVEVQERIEKSGFKHKTYTFPSGKQVKIQGYENYALDYILLSFDEDDIHVGRGQQPEIWYNTDDGKKHRYFPDFLVKVLTKDGKTKTLMVEVKPKKQTKEPEKKQRITKQYINEVATWGVNQAKWKAATEYCLDRNWEFKIITEDDLGL